MEKDCPGAAIPVVLNRLKQKEGNERMGEDVEGVNAENFYKSLDHQGLVFKSNDKKSITKKHSISDVETVKLEQKERLELELEGRKVNLTLDTAAAQRAQVAPRSPLFGNGLIEFKSGFLDFTTSSPTEVTGNFTTSPFVLFGNDPIIFQQASLSSVTGRSGSGTGREKFWFSRGRGEV